MKSSTIWSTGLKVADAAILDASNAPQKTPMRLILLMNF
jgi:hypothetical protein